MRTRWIIEALVTLAMVVSGPGTIRADDPPPSQGQPSEITPARVSYTYGEVSFWRPGAQEWAEAKVNTPLAPGDVLYTGQGGNVEVQFGPRAFVRAGNGTQLGLDNQEPDFVQFRVTSGHAALDVREIAPGNTVEIDTPNAAFTIESKGYYHVDLSEDTTTFRTHRGGSATMTGAAGSATPVPANQQIVVDRDVFIYGQSALVLQGAAINQITDNNQVAFDSGEGTTNGAGTFASNRPIPSCVQSTSELLAWNSSSLSSYLPDLASSMWWPGTFESRVRVGSSKLVAKNPLTRSSCASSTCQRWSPTGVVDEAGFHTSKKLPACGPSWYGRSIGFPPLNVR